MSYYDKITCAIVGSCALAAILITLAGCYKVGLL